MERLIEQPADEGDILEGHVHLGRALYHLSVYQQFSETDNESVPAYLEVEGRITPVDHLDLLELHRRRAELVRHLADGRSLEFSMAAVVIDEAQLPELVHEVIDPRPGSVTARKSRAAASLKPGTSATP